MLSGDRGTSRLAARPVGHHAPLLVGGVPYDMASWTEEDGMITPRETTKEECLFWGESKVEGLSCSEQRDREKGCVLPGSGVP